MRRGVGVCRGVGRGKSKQRLTERGCGGMTPFSDARRDSGSQASTDLLEVHHIWTVENAEVNNKTSDAIQLVQKRQRRSVQAILVDGERAQLDQTHPEFVVTAVASQPPHRDKPLEQAMGGRPWKAGAANNLSERQAARTIEGVEDK